MYRLGCDIGGTFTDFLLYDTRDRRLAELKLLTTPDDPSRAVEEGLRTLAAQHPRLIEGLEVLIHGTTLMINAVIERKGARTALVTTDGFRDILEMRREIRYDIYDLRQRFPVPLVPRSLRFEVPERILADGTIDQPLDEATCRSLLEDINTRGIEALAVVFLHAYANPSHERRFAELVREVAPGLDVSISSDVLPEIREFERTAATAVNAYVRPLVERYIRRLEDRLESTGYRRPLYVMLSGGGIVGADTARAAPVRLAESGPVGGATAALQLGRLAERQEILAFDMGGTTAKACMADGGRLPVTRSYEVDRVHRFKSGSGTPLPVPTVDLIEIGAGGGSIASIDGLGMIKVGPQSAGADPGPICYGRGGTQPTITDCNLVLGYLDPDGFLDGRMQLEREGAAAGIEALGRPLGLDVVQAAHGVIEVVNENMAAAIRMYAAERGGNLGATTMVAFGGAGPLHADGVARKLGIKEILVPRAAGVFSALGFLASPVSYEVARSALTRLDQANPSTIETLFTDLEVTAAAVVREAAPEGVIAFERIADMSYQGQGHQLRVVLDNETFAIGDATRRFKDAYRAAYGYAYDDMEAQIVTVRVVASVSGDLAPVAAPVAAGVAGRGRTRSAYDPITRAFADHDVFTLLDLVPEQRILGPAIIGDRGSTVRIGRGASASFRPEGWLRIEIVDTVAQGMAA